MYHAYEIKPLVYKYQFLGIKKIFFVFFVLIWNDAHLGLEAGEKVDEEGVAVGVGHLEDPLLCQERLHLISRDDVGLLQRFDGEVFRGGLVLAQDDLNKNNRNKKPEQT